MPLPGRTVIALTLMAAILAAAGCNPVTDRVEREVESELPRLIGPADSYESEVTGLSVRTGEAEVVTAVGTRVRPEGAPVVDRLDVELRGVKYDRGERRLERVESARATARIAPADLAAYLNQRGTIEDVAVTLQAPDRATIRARPILQNIPIPQGLTVEVAGRLVGEGGNVHFDVSEVRAAGLTLGGAVARRLSQEINPVVDLSQAGSGLRVTGVRVENGMVVVEASGNLSGTALR